MGFESKNANSAKNHSNGGMDEYVQLAGGGIVVGGLDSGRAAVKIGRGSGHRRMLRRRMRMISERERKRSIVPSKEMDYFIYTLSKAPNYKTLYFSFFFFL